MHPLLNQLSELVAPPKGVLTLSQRTESTTGRALELPADYLEFMGVYGPGKFCSPKGHDFMRIEIIMDCLGDDSESRWMFRGSVEMYENDLRRQFSDRSSALVYFRWGGDDNGISYGWIVDTIKNEWIAASEFRGNIKSCNCSMLELLLTLFRTGIPGDPDQVGFCGIPELWPVTFQRYRLFPAGSGLAEAARCGELTLVKDFVERGDPVDSLSECGCTPLMLAASGGQRRIVRYLISSGANVNYVDSQRAMTPLMWCVASSQTNEVCLAIVTELLAAGADPSMVSNEKMTALVWAQQRQSDELISLLSDHS